jgi:two-component SAPR family response regulator
VQLDLFPEHDRRAGSNYFRQIAHQFRRATGVRLTRKDTDWVTLAPGAVLTSIDVRLQGIATSRSADVLPEFLTVVEHCKGTYLAASSLPWADRRRFELDVLRAEVLHASADAAPGRGELSVAERLAELALRNDPFCEWAFRALDAAARRGGLVERRRSVYRRAQTALAELEIRPEDIGLQAPRI